MASLLKPGKQASSRIIRGEQTDSRNDTSLRHAANMYKDSYTTGLIQQR